MYKLNRFIKFSLYNMFRPLRLSSSKLEYINALLCCYFSPTLTNVYNFLRGQVVCVIYSVNAGCNLYESLKIWLKLILIELENSNKMNRELLLLSFRCLSVYSFTASCHSWAVRISYHHITWYVSTSFLLLKIWQLLQLDHRVLVLDACALFL
jgi:hypothetical protein